ncbi:MAG TPA: ABC transporter permease [Candidatus Acidoferrales bacterium]
MTASSFSGGQFFETLLQDARFGLRMMRKRPAFTAVAILTLAVAICANVVVFSVLNALVLRPIDLPGVQNLYMLEYGPQHWQQSYPDYRDIRDRNRSFEGVMAFTIAPVGLDLGQGSLQSYAYEASGNYFDLLGIQPYLGRFFHPSDEKGPDSAPYLVLSYAYWHSHLHDDPHVIGRTILVNKYPYTVLGVAPPKFRGTVLFFAPDLWVPLVDQDQVEGLSVLNDRGNRSIWIIGRLKSGFTHAQMKGDLDSVAASLAKDYPKEDDGFSFFIARPSLLGDYIGAGVRAFVAGLMTLAALILLAACANLGSLFAARAADRAKEVALRLALGCTRSRIMRQLLTEATLISLFGGAIGVVGSMMLLPWISAWQPLPDIPINVPVNPDATVYVVALLLALASGILFGMVPVRQVLSSDTYQVIKTGAARAFRRFALRDALLVAQIAICAVLVTSSLVAVRGLLRALHSSFGFLSQDTLLLATDLAMARYPLADRPAMQKRMLDAVSTIPGVDSAAYADMVPLGVGINIVAVFPDNAPDLRASKAAAQPSNYNVSPGYFHAAGTTLLAGRVFTWNDDEKSPPVAIVNREFARQVFGSADRALGGYFKIATGTRIEVVGLAEDGKYSSITEDPHAAMFRPILQSPSSATVLLVRSGRDPHQLTPALQSAIRGLDAGLPFTLRTWYKTLDGVMFPGRVATGALGVLGALGAMLSVTGIFGMAAYSVSMRMREFGIRIALGAQNKEVLRAALGRTFRMLALGSVAGLLLGLAASKVLAFIVYQATPRDPVVLVGVLVTMLAVGLLAAWIPARRALATNPLMLMREE